MEIKNSIKEKEPAMNLILKIVKLPLVACVVFMGFLFAAELHGEIKAYYSFDEGEGEKLGDVTGRGNDGRIEGAVWTEGKYGGGLEFDGSEARVTVPRELVSRELSSALRNGPVAVLCWIKPLTAGRFNLFMNMGPYFGIDSNNVLILMGYDGDEEKNAWLRGSTRLSPHKWYHVGFTFEDGVTRFYVDGELDAERKAAGFYPNWRTYSDLVFGRHSAGPFLGVMDEIKIFGRALAEEEVNAEMQKGVQTGR
jgi:hypothetical protein